MTRVLQDVGDDIAFRIIGSTVMPAPPMDFPGGSTWPVDPRYILPPSTPICWSPNGVSWTKPAPGGPILRQPDGSYITPSPQLPTGGRGPVTNGGSVVLPARPGSSPLPVNGSPELTTISSDERVAAMQQAAPTPLLSWMVQLVAVGGLGWIVYGLLKGRERKGARERKRALRRMDGWFPQRPGLPGLELPWERRGN